MPSILYVHACNYVQMDIVFKADGNYEYILLCFYLSCTVQHKATEYSLKRETSTNSYLEKVLNFFWIIAVALSTYTLYLFNLASFASSLQHKTTQIQSNQFNNEKDKERSIMSCS